MELKASDVVRLRSGGPWMTVTEIRRLSGTEKSVWCDWFNEDNHDQPHSSAFNPNSLITFREYRLALLEKDSKDLADKIQQQADSAIKRAGSINEMYQAVVSNWPNRPEPIQTEPIQTEWINQETGEHRVWDNKLGWMTVLGFKPKCVTPMPLIPEAARPVVEILRRDVLRPSELPVSTHSVLRWFKGNLSYCPMGLHPKSKSPNPICSSGFAGRELDNSAAISAFINWWDKLKPEHAQQAVDAIWPTKIKVYLPPNATMRLRYLDTIKGIE